MVLNLEPLRNMVPPQVKFNLEFFCRHFKKEFLVGGFRCNLLTVGEICAHGIKWKLNQTFLLVENKILLMGGFQHLTLA